MPRKAAEAMAVLAIRVTPRASKPGIGGWREDADGRQVLEVRVAAAPNDGEANVAVVRLLATELDIAKGAVRIAAGALSRHKRLEIDLADPDLALRLARLAD